MQYLHIKNLEKYHPNYKDRQLIWCKTYFSMINSDYDFEMLCETDKWRYVAFIMLELQLKKPVPLDPIYLTSKGFNLKKRHISLTLNMLQTLIEVRNGESENPVTHIILEKEKEKEERKKPLSFIAPSAKEVKKYGQSLDPPFDIDGEAFCSFYASKGWMVGKNKMKDWRAAVCTWRRRHVGEVAKASPKPRVVVKCACGTPITMRNANGVPEKQCYECRNKNHKENQAGSVHGDE